MYIVAIAWGFVVILMSAAEAMSGTGVGAFMTLMTYGILPLSVVLYLMGTPERRRRRARREALAQQENPPAMSTPDDGAS